MFYAWIASSSTREILWLISVWQSTRRSKNKAKSENLEVYFFKDFQIHILVKLQYLSHYGQNDRCSYIKPSSYWGTGAIMQKCEKINLGIKNTFYCYQLCKLQFRLYCITEKTCRLKYEIASCCKKEACSTSSMMVAPSGKVVAAAL